jgi:Tol biopolymer transport system component
VVLLLAILPATSLATYPGRNGVIAYTGSERSSSDSRFEIFTIPPAGGSPSRLTHNDRPDTSPAWSADGKKIAFVRSDGYRNHKSAVWIMEADGHNQHLVTSLGFDPHFSPGGRRIVLALPHSIATIGLGGDNLRRVVLGSRIRSIQNPQYSPDGKRIAFDGVPKGNDVNPSIWIVHADGSHLRRLTRPQQKYGYDEGPDWRPDGRRLIFLHSDCNERGCEQAVYSVRADGSRQRRIAWNSYPGVYSPTGNRVALQLVGWDTIYQNVRCADVFTIAAPKRSDRRAVTHNCPHGVVDPTRFTGIAAGPSWQPLPKG